VPPYQANAGGTGDPVAGQAQALESGPMAGDKIAGPTGLIL